VGKCPSTDANLSIGDEEESFQVDSRTAEVIQSWLIARLSELLEIESQEIDVREPFASYGMGSAELVSLSGELAEWLGRQLSPDLAYEYPTIETLARYLAESPDVAPSATTVGEDRQAQPEPIAIIGIGCRFPGANSPQAFWHLLRDGVDAISEVPAERFNLEVFFDPNPAIPGKINTRWGGFLDQVDQFDPRFFGISPREAARMDPQQRLLLELTWEALEDGGQVRERLVGTDTGVFVGISNNDYGRRQLSDFCRIDAYAGTGNALSIAANRISYVFDFRGPSIAIDTACSSSLVAIHLACCSLRTGESTLALAGGVNLILSPAVTIGFTKAGAMAPDGRCKAFDARANGYVRSEGAGLIVLKPLSRALANGDPIYAVIRGSAVNQDGRSNGLMAPNPLAQQAVLREAYRRAAVSPGDVQYVEAHGTGTFLGDPMEAKALGVVLALDRLPGRPCALGSVKTNIGHTEAAAGVAGLIKVALALKHQEIPPSLHFQEPNPQIPFDELRLRVQTTLGPWPAESSPALAGVSSFGFGGANAHVVLEEAPRSNAEMHNVECGMESREIRQTQSAYLLPLSAHSSEALQSLARAYRDFLAIPESRVSLHDLCYTASVRRSHHDYRLAVTGNSPAQLAEGLEAFLRGEVRPGLSAGRKVSGRPRKLVFVFPGQGSQWLGMGRTFLEQDAVFREVVERCDRAMQPYRDWSLLAELAATDAAQSRLNEIAIIQPALFAMQVALAALWRSWGIEPQAVVGHSMGEVAAAHVAGALSLEDAVRLICHRSRLVKPTIGQGAMAAVELSMEEARRVLVGCEDRVSIAVNNSPTSTVLSGDPATLDAILDQLQRQDIFCRAVKVDFASHSPQMDPLRTDLLLALEGLEPRSASVPIYSSVTGMVSNGLELEALYWGRNLREPVLFSTAVQRLLEDGHDIFLEISPHPILLSAIQQGMHHFGLEGAVLPSARREEEDHTVMLGSLGALYALGYPVDWSRTYPAGGRCVRLPFYPWQRERCWLATAAEGPAAGVLSSGPLPDGSPWVLLGDDSQRAVEENLDDWLYEIQWQLKERRAAQRVSEPSLPASPRSWLIFTDSSGVGETLAALLSAQGERGILVARGESYEHTDGEHFCIRPDRPEDLRQLFEALVSDQTLCHGIVHLWSLDIPLPEETTVASVEAVQTLGCGSVLMLVQELAQAQWRDLPRLWLVTRGAQAAEEKPLPLAVAQAPLWGLGRVIAQEHSTLWGGLIDLEPRVPLDDVATHQLREEISRPDGEDQLAFRQGRRYVARLVRKRHSAMQGPPFRWRPDGSYLITGGLGELGLLVARWMVGQGARRLILLGRTRLPPRSSWSSVETGSRCANQIAAIRELEGLGASVHLAAVDVADEGQLSAFLDEFRAEGWPPIRGVVHAAGVLQDGLLSQLDTAALNAVLRPKMVGGWLLHRLLEDAPLDFFVFFSSAGSLLGQPGQGNYAAANAFLDALAHHRRSQGQPALSINWGAWAELGFANTTGGRRLAKHLALVGIQSLAPELALKVLERLLRLGSTQVAVVPVNWAQYLQFHPAGTDPPLLSQLARAEAAIPLQAGHPGEKRDIILAAKPIERPRLLQSYLSEQVARVLGLPASQLDVQQPLSNLGLDSLMAVALKNRIAVDLGVNVAMVKFLQGFSVAEAAPQILEQLTAEAAVPSMPVAGINDPLPEDLDKLSDEQVHSLLTDMLAIEEANE
jgi:acyl transferase domain-containing protein